MTCSRLITIVRSRQSNAVEKLRRAAARERWRGRRDRKKRARHKRAQKVHAPCGEPRLKHAQVTQRHAAALRNAVLIQV